MIFWTSDPLAERCGRRERNAGKGHGVRRETARRAGKIGPELAKTPNPAAAALHGFVAKDNSYYRPIRDAGLASGQLPGN